jgi:hypothetical protein
MMRIGGSELIIILLILGTLFGIVGGVTLAVIFAVRHGKRDSSQR